MRLVGVLLSDICRDEEGYTLGWWWWKTAQRTVTLRALTGGDALLVIVDETVELLQSILVGTLLFRKGMKEIRMHHQVELTKQRVARAVLLRLLLVVVVVVASLGRVRLGLGAVICFMCPRLGSVRSRRTTVLLRSTAEDVKGCSRWAQGRAAGGGGTKRWNRKIGSGGHAAQADQRERRHVSRGEAEMNWCYGAIGKEGLT
mmetsp:Transcript_15043/g.45067  ORF Transcript_15043/g.45067 Transcript_15043/m.45067 type:complete len:202 (+) Transcript_15043:1332-1937(+)